ncbi:MAG: eamA 1, partial [Subtercola sp.]|nr:eamA 1 [Subtercola sp.]
VAFVAWFTGLRHLPAGTVGLVGLLNPVTGVLLGTLVAGEAFGPRQAVGTLLVLAGVLVGQRRRRRDGRGVEDGRGIRTELLDRAQNERDTAHAPVQFCDTQRRD